MAERIIQPGVTRYLIVEGSDDVRFFNKLIDHLQVSDQIHVHPIGGVGNLRDSLIQLMTDPDFESVQHIGIVRDADFGTNAFDNVCNTIRATNSKFPRRELPVPEEPLKSVGTGRKSTILILPDDGTEGMLEDVVLASQSSDVAMACVDDYLECLSDANIEFIQERVSKVRLRVFLASKMISLPESHSDNWLHNIYNRDWWSWDHDRFDAIKDFVRTILR